MLNPRSSFFVSSALFLALLLFFENEFSNSFHSCILQYSSSQTAINSKHGGVGFLEGISQVAVVISQIACTVHFINFHIGFFSIAVALLVAVFTYRLVKSTDELVSSSNEGREATSRAFVFLDGFNVELTRASDASWIDVNDLPKEYQKHPDIYITRFAVQPRWKNSGTTPTKKMSIRVNWQGPAGRNVKQYDYKASASDFFVAPNAVEPSEIIEMPGARALIDYPLRPDGGEPFIFIWGRADYEDVFGKPHFTEWCYRVRFEQHDGKNLRAGFIQWGEHNRTDHE